MKTPAALLISLALIWAQIRAAEPRRDGHDVVARRIPTAEYQNFLVNWDEKKTPVLTAVIRTPAEYAALFHPAPTQRDKRPFAPDARLFDKEQIVLAARVMTAPKNMDAVFSVESVTAKGDELVVKYRFIEPQAGATFSVKNHLALRIPRHDYKKVTFIENGKTVGEISGK